MRVLKGETVNAEEIVARSGKTVRILHVIKIPKRNHSGKIVGLYGIARDVTEHKQAEEALMRSREDMRLLAVRFAEIDEAERKRLSRELHDRVGPTLTALGINLAHVLEELPPAVSPAVMRRLNEACGQAETLADDIRGVMADLRPAVLDDYGLVAALRGHGHEVARRSGLAVMVEEEGVIGRLPPEVETGVFRIVQEAITNVVRLARATEVCITCEKDQARCRVIIADNGRGFDVAAAQAQKANWGLSIMRERAQAIGCAVSMHSRAGRGTTVVVDIPTRTVRPQAPGSAGGGGRTKIPSPQRAGARKARRELKTENQECSV